MTEHYRPIKAHFLSQTIISHYGVFNVLAKQ